MGTLIKLKRLDWNLTHLEATFLNSQLSSFYGYYEVTTKLLKT